MTSQSSMMVVPSLPQRVPGCLVMPSRHSVTDLLDHFASPFVVNDLECPICGLRDQQGTVQLQLERPLPGVVIMRVNRYTATGKRPDHIQPEPVLELAGALYDLGAIVEHRGSSVHHGHYVTLLRTRSGWETRDDGVMRASMKTVYTLVVV